MWLSTQPWFQLRYLWYTSVATVALQALAALWLVLREMRLRLSAMEAPEGEALVAETPGAV